MTYSFYCKDCGKIFDIDKGINEEIEIKCTECNSKKVKRIFVPISNVWNCTGSYNQTRK